MRSGDVRSASDLYDAAGLALDNFAPLALPAMKAEITAEAELLRDLSARALHDDASRMLAFQHAQRAKKDGGGPFR